ncbi:hypothetical protein FPOA_01609 [Fusarium poae]|uniref:Uncharacterized protein n=1 Tax=Fusarium poae TaxID=36050 RepID=A0A1B8B4M2_FUSPO|nr:hypothetical protein FPOA_01609 [Fusarium poae]
MYQHTHETNVCWDRTERDAFGVHVSETEPCNTPSTFDRQSEYPVAKERYFSLPLSEQGAEETTHSCHVTMY